MQVSPSAKTPMRSWTVGTAQKSVPSTRYRVAINIWWWERVKTFFSEWPELTYTESKTLRLVYMSPFWTAGKGDACFNFSNLFLHPLPSSAVGLSLVEWPVWSTQVNTVRLVFFPEHLQTSLFFVIYKSAHQFSGVSWSLRFFISP